MRFYLFFLLFLGSNMLMHSSSMRSKRYKPIRKAENFITREKYCCASKYLEKALLKDTNNEYIHYRLGYSYYMSGEFERAVGHYEASNRLMKDSMKYNFEMYHLYSSLGLSSFAKEAFIKYINLCPSCVKVDLLPGLTSNKMMYRKPIKEAKLMGYEEASSAYYPYLLDDNSVLHLEVKQKKGQSSHANHYSNYLTTHFSKKDFLFYNSEEFSKNNKGSGDKFGPFVLNDSLDEIYITRWNETDNRLFLYFSKRGNKSTEKWSTYRPLEIDGDDFKANFIHPMLSWDGKQLIFSSNRHGGIGGYDLWVGDLVDKYQLKNIKSLGTYINTPGDEVYPSMGEEDILFFSSNGHYGFGDLDLYVGLKSKGKYEKTYNLGNRFNSNYDDYALFNNKKHNITFYTSNRYETESKSTTMDRIYSQSFDKVLTTIDVIDQHRNMVSDIQISIPSENVNVRTNENGKVEAAISPNGYKKLHILGDKYIRLDTVIQPFENRLSFQVEKKEPKDQVTIWLVSHPHEYPARNTFFTITSQKDHKKFCGKTDINGACVMTLYGDESYEVEVPAYSYVKKDNQPEGLTKWKFQVYSDLPKREVAKANESINNASKEDTREISLTDNYNIYYESGQSSVTENLNRQIQHSISILNRNPQYKLEITSYTDCQGDKNYNLSLSKRRMEELKMLFFSRGVAEKQIIGKYSGEASPLNNCSCDSMNNYNCSPDEIKKNRRTEIKLIK